MAITIFYMIRLAKSADVAPFLTAAKSEAKRRKWNVVPIAGGPKHAKSASSGIEILPHAKCEPIRLEFSRSLTCNAFVKTGYAPLKTHMAVVEFLRAIKPLAKSFKVEDEGEYWETGDAALLNRHRDGFDEAFGKKPIKPGSEIVFTLGALVGVTTPGGGTKFVPGECKVVRVKGTPKDGRGKRSKRR